MKKNILYFGIAVMIGLLGGYLIFGASADSANKTVDNHDHSETSANQMWTCSMHPQIMQPEPGDCPICGMELIPAEASSEGLAANQIKMTENALALANIETTIVGNLKESNDDGVISLSGKIAANEENNAIQASYFDGRLERLNVSFEGQEVKRGQLLATIYSPNLVAAQQELITATSLKQFQPALYKAVRNKLKLWKLSESQIDNIESTGEVRENFPLYATVSGTVAMVMAAEGDYLKQGQPILKVSNLNSVWAEFDAYENQISQFKKGQKIKVTTSAYPKKEFDAVISFIDPVLNSSTRTVTVRTTLKNNENLFKPGMFVSGKIKGTAKAVEESLNIPASAVLWTGERSLVYVKLNPNEPVFEMREVTVGLRNGDNFTVTSGLENGEEIVTNGTFTVDAAAQLQGKKSMMNKSGRKTMTGHEGHSGMQGDSENKSNAIPTMKMKLPKAFQTAFQAALKPYFKMKDAFVASDANQVSALAKTTFEKMKGIEIGGLGKIEKSHLSKSIEMFSAISSNSDLKTQRAQLVVLNENIVALAMNIKSPVETLYLQKCPMANNGHGAIWLSTQSDIKNPYYGEAMLTCGSVIKTIE
ncbi:efflux RND transporter periplasmic adaptor subunit [Maribacter algarum]|uniref:Efflux RND transporter periplasmic adaptor subunit n=1 Tax=Maribacter algarum (ex Zhang et al. 2020) TaxID=2578118 RepID=A0A5S3PH18_9FLAO|nr:efflux RND transporter periplasmic adaptor subunit [Maribacter algarum]TMM53433.1 efflux RND transporter periplasmic adaptor subunit [Maribacter algarum]